MANKPLYLPQPPFTGKGVGECGGEYCPKFRGWQEKLAMTREHSDNYIYELSADKKDACTEVHGCIFEQSVEIVGVRDA